ncbi:MAG: methyltransferase domain-containing protein [Anaerolineae bacterium]|nr:methyltransferase domain-containing protein [Anaerolineae bacterium]
MPNSTNTVLFEAEVLPGLERFAVSELRRRLVEANFFVPQSGGVPFSYPGPMSDLASPRTVTAVYQVLRLDVPRPKAFLGHQVFTRIVSSIRSIIGGQAGFRTLSLDAAGADSAVMLRVKRELALAVGLEETSEKGDLHIRVRRTKESDSWDILIRLTPRPLATRSWRIHNFQGALNAAVAAAMADMTTPAEGDSVLNLCCGSGSLVIERAFRTSSRLLIGVDNDSRVLQLANEHLEAAMLSDACLICGDVTELPLPSSAFDVLLADIPFGQLVGSHQVNKKLYPALMKEAARVACRGARFALITHEKRLIGDVISAQSAWTVHDRIPVNLNGLHPDILVLRRE